MLNAIQIFDTILDFFKNLGEFVIERVVDGTQPSDLLLAIAVGGFLVYLIIAWIQSGKSYEMKLIKSLDDLNSYFYTNPIVNSDNLKIFNNKMKLVPKAMREQWQMYMLYKDKEPSQFLSVENCIERPMRYSSYKNTIRHSNLAFGIYMIVLMAVACGGILFNADSTEIGAALFNTLMIPAIIYILKFLVNLIMDMRYNAVVSDIYTNFNIFQRCIDKAVVGMPNYIDYEMLFTKKEIKNNIPILQDYIERRERKEKEELEKAKNSEVEHDDFNFDAVGMSASLVLERALRECETFINNKKRLLYKISQKDQELLDYKNNYEELHKEHLKQQQVGKENLERLRHSAETSTNRLEASRIAKQQEEEMKRQEQLEKDVNTAYDKYVKQKEVIEKEINALQSELDAKKQYIEDVMMAEFKTYTSKLYDEVSQSNAQEYQSLIEEMKEDNEILSDEIKDKILLLESNGIKCAPTLRYEVKLAKDKEKEFKLRQAQRVENDARLAEAMKVKEEADKAEDASNEVVKEETPVVIENASEDVETNEVQQSEEVTANEVEQNQVETNEDAVNEKEVTEKVIDEEKLKQDLKNELADELDRSKLKEELLSELKEELKKNEEENKYDAYGGYYDDRGYYYYSDGCYYDVEGNYYDANGRLLVPASQNPNYSLTGDYDENGNYVYSDGSYYDPNGNYYNANGELVAQAEVSAEQPQTDEAVDAQNAPDAQSVEEMFNSEMERINNLQNPQQNENDEKTENADKKDEGENN